MGTLSGLLDLSRSALLADQTAIDATAQNISNENTAGYARRSVSFAVQDSVTLSGASVSLGTTATVSAQRDPILDRATQAASSAAAASGARLSALNQLQSVFAPAADGQDGAGIGAAINGLFNSASALGPDGSNASARQGFVAAAQTFAGTLNRASAAIASQSASLDGQVGALATQLNALTAQYAKVNGQLASGGAQDSSGLEDQRQTLLDQIASVIGTQQVHTENHGVTLVAGGAVLVSGGTAGPISTSVSGGVTHLFASNGTDVTGSISGGALGGVLQARDVDLPKVSSALDAIASAVGGAVNLQHALGVDANGNPGGAVFAFTAGQPAARGISVALTGSSGVAAAAVGEGAIGGGNANALAAIAQQSIVSGQTASGALSGALSALGSVVAATQSQNGTDRAAQTQAEGQRDQYSGVSLDTEGANLTQYQRSYEASAKVLAIVNDLLAAAINLGTPTTVS